MITGSHSSLFGHLALIRILRVEHISEH